MITPEIDKMTSTRADSQARGLHRIEGRRPFGNNRIKKVPISPTAGTHVQEFSARLRSARGNAPLLTTKA
jgi:hypothetical protein